MLLASGYANWPQALPVRPHAPIQFLTNSTFLQVLFMHGDADPVDYSPILIKCALTFIKVVSYPGSKALFEKLPATDKKFVTYPVS
jgi:hypothetical protein